MHSLSSFAEFIPANTTIVARVFQTEQASLADRSIKETMSREDPTENKAAPTYKNLTLSSLHKTDKA